MPTLPRFLLLAPLALLASACASTPPECKADQSYLTAISVAPLKASTGLVVPDSPAALRIPDVANTPSASVNATNHRTACLDFPPTIVGNPEKSAEK